MLQTVLFVALLCAPDVITAAKDGAIPPIKTEKGLNVTLQCRLDPTVNLVQYLSFWARADLHGLVHVYRPGRDYLGPQLHSYRGRTTVIHEEDPGGVLSLQISSVQLSDAGPYRCYVPRLRAGCTINLIVEEGDTPSTARPPLDPVTEPDHPEVRREEKQKEEEEKEEEKEEKEEEKEKLQGPAEDHVRTIV